MLSRGLCTFVTIALVVGLDPTQACGQKIYWTEHVTGRVQRADLSGASPEPLIEKGPVEPVDIALDLTAEKMYWTDADGIQRANLDGTGVEPLVSGSPRSITLDVSAGKMYWTEGTTVRRANLNGSDASTIFPGGGWPLGGIAIDVSAQKLYVSTSFALLFYRMNPDGTNVEIILGDPNSPNIDSSPLDIDLDVAGGKMYWVEGFPFPKVGRANLDGSNVQFIIAHVWFDASSIALDVDAGKVYWNTLGSIFRANLDGSQIEEVLFTGMEGPLGIALDLRVSVVTASLDIAPGSCPKAVNVRSNGVVTMAVTGSDDLDAAGIDPTSLVLRRADGTGGGLSPRVSGQGKVGRYADVSTPFFGDLCECRSTGRDGKVDLIVQFLTRDMAEVLQLGVVPQKSALTLVLTGSLWDGTPFEGRDCITVIGTR